MEYRRKEEYLAVGKPVQEPALLDVLLLQDDVSVPASARSRDDVLVEGKRYEAYHAQHVNYGAYGAHALG